MTKKEEIVKSPQEMTAGVPEHLRKASGEKPLGKENIGKDDMVMPRIGLCQSMTPQRKKGDPTYIEGLEEGQYFNTVTGHIYGNSIKVVPLHYFKNRIRFAPLEKGGGILCQAPDFLTGVGDPGGNCSTCPMSMFHDGVKPECTEFRNFPVLVIPDNGPLTLSALAVKSFKSGGIKQAKHWNSLIQFRGTDLDIFAGIYSLRSVESKNSKGTWYSDRVDNASWVSPEILPLLKDAYHAIIDSGLRIAGSDEAGNLLDSEEI